MRRALLLVGIAGVAGLAVLLVTSFGGGPSPVDSGPLPDDDGAVLSGERIDFVQTSGGEPVFRVRADTSSQDQAGVLRLEGVTLEIYRQDQENLTIESQRATLDQNTQDARLEGDVVISGWGTLEVESRALDVIGNGESLISREAVRFRQPGGGEGPDLVGRASQMRVDKASDTIFLDGGVHLKTEPGAAEPMALDCQRLLYRRGEGLIRAVEDVYLRRGDQEIRAHYLSLFLNDDRSVRTVRARWSVEGSIVEVDEAGGEGRVSFRGQFLEMSPRPGDPASDATYRDVVIRGSDEEPAVLRAISADGLGRVLEARELQAASYDGALSRVEGTGAPLVFAEVLAMPDQDVPLRQVCAERLVAGFRADGTLDQMFLEDQVSLHDETIQLAGGDQALVNGVSGRIEIEGEAVELYADRGEIVAPKIRYSRPTGLVQAEGGVQAVLTGASGLLDGTPLSEGDGPVRVQSREAHWTAAPPGFVFKGAVRAWRGQNLLLADQLRGDQATGELAASGGVRSTWIPVDAAGQRQDALVEVSARTLAFRGQENVVVYTGDVSVEQGRRTIRCSELTVEMVQGGSAAEKMICRGDVRLDDPVGGQEVTGDLAVYRVPAQTVEVFGDRVRLLDAQKNRAEGGYLVYDLETGQARVSQRPPTGADSVSTDPGSRP